MTKNRPDFVYYQFEVPIYNQPFFFCFGEKKACADYLKKRSLADLPISGVGGYFTSEDDLSMMGVFIEAERGSWFPPETVSILSHELVHAIHFMLGRRGITLSDSSDEAYAYLQGYLMNKGLEVLHKWLTVE